jgi:hypothetical protein
MDINQWKRDVWVLYDHCARRVHTAASASTCLDFEDPEREDDVGARNVADMIHHAVMEVPLHDLFWPHIVPVLKKLFFPNGWDDVVSLPILRSDIHYFVLTSTRTSSAADMYFVDMVDAHKHLPVNDKLWIGIAVHMIGGEWGLGDLFRLMIKVLGCDSNWRVRSFLATCEFACMVKSNTPVPVAKRRKHGNICLAKLHGDHMLTIYDHMYTDRRRRIDVLQHPFTSWWSGCDAKAVIHVLVSRLTAKARAAIMDLECTLGLRVLDSRRDHFLELVGRQR